MLTELRTYFSGGGDREQEMGGTTLPVPLLRLPEGRRAPAAPPAPPAPGCGTGLPRVSHPHPSARRGTGSSVCPTASPATPQRGSRRLLINPALGY